VASQADWLEELHAQLQVKLGKSKFRFRSYFSEGPLEIAEVHYDPQEDTVYIDLQGE
jgi:DNA relaxase NicK